MGVDDEKSKQSELSPERLEFLNALSGHLVEAQAVLQRLITGEQLTDIDREFLGRHLQKPVSSAVLNTTTEGVKDDLMSALDEKKQERVAEKSKDIFPIFVGSVDAGVKKQIIVGELQGDLRDGVFAASTFELKLQASPSEAVKVLEKLRIKSKVLDEIRKSNRASVILDVRCIFDSSSCPEVTSVNSSHKKQMWDLGLVPNPSQEQTELDVDVYDMEQSPPRLIIRAYPDGYFRGR